MILHILVHRGWLYHSLHSPLTLIQIFWVERLLYGRGFRHLFLIGEELTHALCFPLRFDLLIIRCTLKKKKKKKLKRNKTKKQKERKNKKKEKKEKKRRKKRKEKSVYLCIVSSSIKCLY